MYLYSKATPVLGKMGNPGSESKGSNNTQRGLHPPVPVQTQPNQITNCHKQLCQPSLKSQLVFSIFQMFGTGWVVILVGGYADTRSDGRI